MRISFLLILSVFPLFLTAQERPFNDETRPFFEAQVPYFNHWLQAKGLNEALLYESMSFRPNMLTVYCYLKPYDRDSAAAAYDRLHKDFEQTTGDSLEGALFDYLTFLMEVKPEQLTIEIYDVNGADSRTPCFYKGIYHEGGQLLTERSVCRDQSAEIELAAFEVKQGVIVKETRLEGASPEYLTKKKVFSEIEAFAKDYFELREGSFAVLKRGQSLKFECKDMTREVLPESFFDWFTGAKKEWLRFTIGYENTGQAINLEIKVHGKFGSGLFSLTDSGYRPMEPDYESELQRYTDKFGEEVRAHLSE